MVGKRGFTDPDEHDWTIIKRHNEIVTPDDIVWMHGDVGLGSDDQVLTLASALNGEKHLITGNHDRCWPGHRDAHKHQRQWLEVFASVQAFARRRIGDHEVLLSHLPYDGDHTPEDRHTQFRLRDEGLWLLCGHVHGLWKVHPGGRQINVGLDVWELAPVAEDVLAKMMR